MARQRLGQKKVRRLRDLTGLEIVAVLVRGNTHHRQDLCLADGWVVYRWPNGTMEDAGIRHCLSATRSELSPGSA
jgi:hypothetical protein